MTALVSGIKLAPVESLKLLPVIVIKAPAFDEVGVKLVMVGPGRKVKPERVRGLPEAGVTLTEPLAPLPTTAVIVVPSVLTVTAEAAVPPKLTAVAPVRLVPKIVTEAPL